MIDAVSCRMLKDTRFDDATDRKPQSPVDPTAKRVVRSWDEMMLKQRAVQTAQCSAVAAVLGRSMTLDAQYLPAEGEVLPKIQIDGERTKDTRCPGRNRRGVRTL